MTDLLEDTKYLVPRALLAKYFGEDPRLVRAFELQAEVVAGHDEILQVNVAATGELQDATVVTLSPNTALANEYVLTQGDGTALRVAPGSLKIDVDPTVARAPNYPVTLLAPVGVTLQLPAGGQLMSDTDAGPLVNAATDAAAAGAGVPVGGVYHNAGALRVRLV